MHVWAPNQMPVLVRWLCADIAGLTVDKTHVHTTSLGGGSAGAAKSTMRSMRRCWPRRLTAVRSR
jgi:hypothetical protein